MIDVKIDKFQGPLSLLLKIIEKEELDITSINLAKIADEYLDYVKNSPDILPEALADFLLMAARLLYIKSRALLPYLLSEEEKEEIADLEKKLKIYKDFIDLGIKVQKMIGRKKFSFSRSVNRQARRFSLGEKSFFSPKNVKAETLHEGFVNILERLESSREESLGQSTIITEVSIEERICFIKDTLVKKIKVNFSQIIRGARSRTELIVNFLAVLELVKQKELDFTQDELFSDIIVRKIESEV